MTSEKKKAKKDGKKVAAAADSPVFPAPNFFFFCLRQVVKIVESDEVGTVHGRAEYTTSEPQYLIRYKAADGRAVEAWWPENALLAA